MSDLIRSFSFLLIDCSIVENSQARQYDIVSWHFAEETSSMDEESSQFSLSWDHFGKNLQDTWRHLHQSEEFADVTLACDLGQVTQYLEIMWTSFTHR